MAAVGGKMCEEFRGGVEDSSIQRTGEIRLLGHPASPRLQHALHLNLWGHAGERGVEAKKVSVCIVPVGWREAVVHQAVEGAQEGGSQREIGEWTIHLMSGRRIHGGGASWRGLASRAWLGLRADGVESGSGGCELRSQAAERDPVITAGQLKMSSANPAGEGVDGSHQPVSIPIAGPRAGTLPTLPPELLSFAPATWQQRRQRCPRLVDRVHAHGVSEG